VLGKLVQRGQDATSMHSDTESTEQGSTEKDDIETPKT
jgi:hypothetical protein